MWKFVILDFPAPPQNDIPELHLQWEEEEPISAKMKYVNFSVLFAVCTKTACSS